MFEAVGYRVKHLIRVRIANLRLGDLARGHWRALTAGELNILQARSKVVAAGADRSSQKAGHLRHRRGQRPPLPVK